MKDFTHISFSEFAMYLNCPHQHLVFNYLKLDERDPSIHLYFGNCIHESFELALKDKLNVEDRVKQFKEEFYKQMVDNMKGLPGFKDVFDFLKQGEHIIRSFDTEELIGKYEIVSTEERVYEPIHGKYHFKGFIDLVLKNKETGRYLIVDWKTSGQAWDVKKKVKDDIFLSQMRFYKFFWARKHNVDINDIDCQYIVLNRLVNSRNPSEGLGKPQYVNIDSTQDEIEHSLTTLANVIKGIHINGHFPKIKNIDAKKIKKNPGCLHCKYSNKGKGHPMCNSNPDQYKQFLLEHKY